ncbi:MAG: hypothetical protein IGS49_04770 [Chlorogloeopsis fritschii C42_A2020_084]|jgi:hypothetical protein|uniref:hypothetical protein n=1 Tax=Chlorogloeopsis fritschii TaxID=1124 RepID=UPI0019FFA515|nr:hypothetical protein [Chlorogloeopsis fritschii]MBF2004780.1 hypothetical protein [Chlorogloeopsis fritschii C42_A2020_084]
MNKSVLNQVIEQLKIMPEDLQWQVLEFTRALAGTKIRGVPGRQMLRFAGAIPPDDIQLIREAIEPS